MSARISTKKSNIAVSYMKRTAGLITNAAGLYFSQAMPTTSGIFDGAKDLASSAKNSISSAIGVLPKFREIKAQSIFKNINDWFLGEESNYEDTSTENMNFDIEGLEDDSDISKAQISEAEKSANKVGKAVIESSHKMVETQALSTANITSAIEQQTSAINEGFKTTNDLLSKILEITTKNTATLIEATVASNRERDARENMLSRGRFSFNDYKKMVGKNIEYSEIGAILPYLSMLKDGTWKDFLSPENLVSIGLEGLIAKTAPKLKKNMEALDDTINSVLINSLIRIGNNQKDGIMGSLGRMLGIQAGHEKVDTSGYKSGLEIKSISWDTISKEYLTNAIPGYLRKILVQLGGEDVIYDARSRSFRTKASFQKKFEQNTTIDTGQLGRASKKIQKGLYKDSTDNQSMRMYYDLIMQDLGANYDDKDARDKIDSLRSPREMAKYLQELTKGMDLDRLDLKAQDQFIKNFSEMIQDEQNRIDISTQAHRAELNRQLKGRNYVENAEAYNVDLSDFTDTRKNNRLGIFRDYDRTVTERDDKGAVISTTAKRTINRVPTGIDYTNRALYEIYQRLETGINVFKVGEFTWSNLRRNHYKKKKRLPPPLGYNLSDNNSTKDENTQKSGNARINGVNPNRYEDDPNLLRNNEKDDGNKEDLSRMDRFKRWSKKRGRQFKKAMFNGSTDDIREVISDILTDVSEVAGDGVKKGIAKINTAFGNVSGYMKHKLFGSEYTYQDGTDKDGKPIMKTVKKNENGGIFGFLSTEVKSMFGDVKDKATNWWKDVKGYFDFADKDDEDDPDIVKKRKKLIGTIAGSLGGGMFAGPMGAIIGGLAGSALTTTGIGKKISKFLFGTDKKGKPTGVFNKLADKIISPIQYQVGKTASYLGAALKKHVFGPMSDLGLAIKDRITTHVESLFSLITKPVRKVVGGVIKGIGKATGKLFTTVATIGSRFTTTLFGKGARAAIGVLGSAVGGFQRGLTRSFSKNSYHKLKRGETYFLLIGDKFYDPSEEDENKKGKDRSCVHELVDDASSKYYARIEEIDELGGVRGIKLDGDRKNELRPYTRDYIKRRRKERNQNIDQELKKSGYYKHGGVFGFLGRDYKAWHAKKYEDRADRKRRLQEATKEEEASKADQETADNTAEIKENTQRISDTLEEERIPGSSFKTHDQGLWDRVDQIIDLLGGKDSDQEDEGPTIHTDNEKEEVAPQVGAVIAKEEDERKENKELASTALIASGQAAMSGDSINKAEQTNLFATVDAATSDNPKPMSVRERLKKMFRMQQEGKQESEKEKESIFSKLFEGLGSLVGKFWPLILGGLALFNDNIRELIFDKVLPTAANWLSNNLPGILKGAWEGYQKASETITNVDNDMSTVHDEVDNTDKTVMTAEDLHEKKANGEFISAVKDNTSLLSMGRNALDQFVIGKAGTLATSLGSVAPKAGAALTKFVGNKVIASNATSTGAKVAAVNAITTTSAASSFASALPKGFSNLGGAILGVVGETGSHIITSTLETSRHQDILGGYGLSDSAGSARMGSTRLNNNLALATGASTRIAFAVAYAAASAGLLNSWNPVGWGLLIGSIVMLAMWKISAIINTIAYWAQEKSDIKYSVNTNSAKLNRVINGTAINYNQDSPYYVYSPTDSDRVLGLNQGVYIKNPEYRFGQFFKAIREGMIASGSEAIPGSEVLLYDLLNNMTVQGVPFAVYASQKDSREVSYSEKDQANAQYDCIPIQTNSGWSNKTQVRFKTVDANSDTVINDINRTIAVYDNTAGFTLEDARALYDAGKKVYDALLKQGILNADGKVQTKKFKNAPGSKSGCEGWTALEKLGNSEGVYFVQQCLIYINSKVDVDKNGQQWIAVNQSNIDELGKRLKDVAEGEAKAAIQELKNRGLTDEEIKAITDPKSEEAKEAASVTPAAVFSENQKDSINSALNDTQRSNIAKYMRYFASSYMYAHPEVLQKWAQKHTNEIKKATGAQSSDINKFASWNSITDKKEKSAIQGEMVTAAQMYSESLTNPDIFNMIPNINWHSVKNKSEIGTTSNETDAAYRDMAKKLLEKAEQSTLGKLWESGAVSQETPEEMHEDLVGNKSHGKGAEISSMPWYSGMSSMSNYGALAELANFSTYFPTDSWNSATTKSGESNKWLQAIVAANFGNPSNLPIGGPSNDDEEDIGNTKATIGAAALGMNGSFKKPTTAPTSTVMGMNGPVRQDTFNPFDTSGQIIDQMKNKETPLISTIANDTPGGNPLDKNYLISSGYGFRDINGSQEFHSGIDMYPEDGSNQARVDSRFSGQVIGVKKNVPDSHTGLDVTENEEGNYVYVQAPDGTIIKSMHLKAGSIPDNIKIGSQVNIGDKIGEMGETGRSDGAHLHYEMENPNVIDPMNGHSIDPTNTLNGYSGTTVTNAISDAAATTSAISGYSSDSYYDSSDTSTSSTGILGVIEALKNAGYQILSKLTGGLIGNENSNNTQGGSSTISDSYGLYTTSGSLSGAVTSPNGEVRNVEDFLNIVRREVGVHEQGYSNKVKYGEWYGMNGQPWCMMFVQWCFDKAGYTLECRTASCSEMVTWYNKNKPNLICVAGKGTPKPGDIAIFRNSEDTICHTGIIEKVNSNTDINTIEGNTSATNGGSQDNGGCVAKKHRTTAKSQMYFAYWIRPVDWDAVAATSRSTSAISSTGNINNAESMFAYLKSLGYSDEAAAAIVGCWEPESSNNAKKVEWDYNKAFAEIGGSKEASYDAIATNREATDAFTQKLIKCYQDMYYNGKISYWVGGKGYQSNGHYYPGLGYAQWTGPEARQLIEYAAQNNMKWYDPALQLSFLDNHMKGAYNSTYNKLMQPTTLEQATHDFAYGYENPSMPSQQYADRISAAKRIYSQFKNKYTTKSNTGGPKLSENQGEYIDFKKANMMPEEEGAYVPPEKPTSTISKTNYVEKEQHVGGPTKKKNKYTTKSNTGGPSDVSSTYRSLPPTSEVQHTDTITSTNQNNQYLNQVVNMLGQVYSVLVNIQDNTGTSSDYLSSINEKDFVDQGLRDSISAASKTSSKKKGLSRSSNTSAKQVLNMARP